MPCFHLFPLMQDNLWTRCQCNFRNIICIVIYLDKCNGWRDGCLYAESSVLIGDQWQHSNQFARVREESRGEQNLTRTILTHVSSVFELKHGVRFVFFPSMKCVCCGFVVKCGFGAMGRLNKTGAGSSVSVHYRKLTEDYNGSACEALKLMPSLPEYMSYCCHHCGHTQKLKVKSVKQWWNLDFFSFWKKWASTPLLFMEC